MEELGKVSGAVTSGNKGSVGERAPRCTILNRSGRGAGEVRPRSR